MNKSRREYSIRGAYLLPALGFGNEVLACEHLLLEFMFECRTEYDLYYDFSFRDTILQQSLEIFLMMLLEEDVDNDWFLCYSDPTGEINSDDKLKDRGMLVLHNMPAKALIS